MRLDMKALADGVIDIVKGYVQQVQASLLSRIDEIEKELRSLPPPKDGAAGKDGVDGRDATPVDTDAVVAAVLAMMPAAKDGNNGRDGQPGKDGADGKSFGIEEAKSFLESEMSKWALDFERRAQDTLQKTIDRMPKPKDGVDGLNGRDGIDAMGFDDLSVVHDGRRGFIIKFIAGDRTKEFEFAVPVVLDCGYFREGDSFEKGDGVTFGGSYWIAQATTQSKPEIGNPDWRLAVKKGRDGKEGRDGVDKTAPVRLS